MDSYSMILKNYTYDFLINCIVGRGDSIAYLLGSGLSIPFGLPSVSYLTKKILSYDDLVGLHTDGTYVVGWRDTVNNNKCISSVRGNPVLGYIARDFLNLVANWIINNKSFPLDHEPNYEDIYDVIRQFHLNDIKEYENPALSQDFLNLAEQFAQKHFVETCRLLEYSLYFMDCVIKYYLGVSDLQLRENAWIIGKLLSPVKNQKEVDIFSLNHDLLLEHYFELNDTRYNDGFYEDVHGLKRFDAEKFYSSKVRMRLIKLHGSIDRYIHDNTVIRADDPRYINAPASNNFANDFIPRFVTGKITKLIEYSAPAQADFHSYFRIRLETSVSTLVVIGYGFADGSVSNVGVKLSSTFKEKG